MAHVQVRSLSSVSGWSRWSRWSWKPGWANRTWSSRGSHGARRTCQVNKQIKKKLKSPMESKNLERNHFFLYYFAYISLQRQRYTILDNCIRCIKGVLGKISPFPSPSIPDQKSLFLLMAYSTILLSRSTHFASYL